MRVSKKEMARRKQLFHVYMSASRARDCDNDLFRSLQNNLNRVLNNQIPMTFNGRGESMALCTDAAEYFGVTPRSMQRLFAAYFGPQRPRAKRRSK